jgi:flagellar biosynthesis/type III secretory pathway protein FliH
VTLPRGRIVRGSASHAAKTAPLGGAVVPPQGRLVSRIVADAAEEAAQYRVRAETAARAILDSAEEKARVLREQARTEGREEGASELAAAWLRMRAEQNARAEQDLDRTVELARAIAERLIGETLALEPSKIAAMARQTLAAAQQARRIVMRAHPRDAEALSTELSSLGLEQAAIEIHADEARTRGSLLLETDLGILDADLTIQLDRLARSLRDGLRP